jgi:hypothetical protein
MFSFHPDKCIKTPFRKIEPYQPNNHQEIVPPREREKTRAKNRKADERKEVEALGIESGWGNTGSES